MFSSHQSIILDYPITTLAVLGLVDMLLPLLIFYFASRLGDVVWLLHGLAVLFLLVSPFILFYLATDHLVMPQINYIEAPAPSGELIVLPLLGLLLLEFPIYFITLVVIAIRKFLMKPMAQT
jgi:hypothetical protein